AAEAAALAAAASAATLAASSAGSATASALAASALAAPATFTAAAAALTAARLPGRLRLQVDHEPVLANLDAAARLRLAAEHRHAARARRAIADGLERLDETRQPIAGDRERLAELARELLGSDAFTDQLRLRVRRLTNGQTTELGNGA